MLQVCVGKGQGEGRTVIAPHFKDISVYKASGILGAVSARLSNGRRPASNRSVLPPLPGFRKLPEYAVFEVRPSMMADGLLCFAFLST